MVGPSVRGGQGAQPSRVESTHRRPPPGFSRQGRLHVHREGLSRGAGRALWFSRVGAAPASWPQAARRPQAQTLASKDHFPSGASAPWRSRTWGCAGDRGTSQGHRTSSHGATPAPGGATPANGEAPQRGEGAPSQNPAAAATVLLAPVRETGRGTPQNTTRISQGKEPLCGGK